MEEKVVTIEKVVFGGKGLTRDLGKVALVPFALPGEQVRIRILRERKDYIEAEIVDILKSSRERVAPDCRYFGVCGGCQISHANYPTQLKWKEEILRETFQRARLPVPAVEVLNGQPFRYRHRARLKYDPRTKALGFCERESNRIVSIAECLCLTPGLNRLLRILQNNLQGLTVPKLKEIQCFENDRGQTIVYFDAPLPDPMKKIIERDTSVIDTRNSQDFELSLRFRDYQLPMRADIFLQANPRLWKAMIQEVESHHVNSTDQTAVELYAGAGFFTVPLAKHFRRIVACEENKSAVMFAKRSHPLTNTEWISSRAETFRFPEDATALIVDPPRAGLHKTVINHVVDHDFQRISYISCDCTSLARDLKLLQQKYSLAKIVLIDLFPQTFHFETISLLQSNRLGLKKKTAINRK